MPRPHILALALVSAFLVPSAGHAQAAAAQYGESVRLEQAKALVALARAEAGSRGLAMAFAVALPSGDPILLEVMDGTQFASTAISPAKARTAARFRKPTKVLQEAAAAATLLMPGPMAHWRWKAGCRSSAEAR